MITEIGVHDISSNSDNLMSGGGRARVEGRRGGRGSRAISLFVVVHSHHVT